MNHLAYIIPTVDRIGGAEMQVLLLSAGMAKRGWRVSLIALSGSENRSVSQQIEFVSLNMRKGLADPRGWITFHRWLTTERPDIVHAHLPHATLLARWSRITARMRSLVETIHSPATGGSLRKIAYRVSSPMTDVICSVSRSAAKPWVSCRSINEDRLAVIPNGIDPQFWMRDECSRADLRRELGLHDTFVWLAVGRLHPVKDHASLLRAFAKIPGRSFLLIVGSGPLERELKGLAGKLGLDGRVRFLGYQSKVLKWMQAADAFVLSSRWEGLPIALLEASACELPSVIPEIPGAREVLPGSQLCAAAPAGNPDALALAMSELMTLSASERRAMGQRARNAVIQRFTLDYVLDRWEGLYNGLVEVSPYLRRFGLSSETRGTILQLQ